MNAGFRNAMLAVTAIAPFLAACAHGVDTYVSDQLCEPKKGEGGVILMGADNKPQQNCVTYDGLAHTQDHFRDVYVNYDGERDRNGNLLSAKVTSTPTIATTEVAAGFKLVFEGLASVGQFFQGTGILISAVQSLTQSSESLAATGFGSFNTPSDGHMRFKGNGHGNREYDAGNGNKIVVNGKGEIWGASRDGHYSRFNGRSFEAQSPRAAQQANVVNITDSSGTFNLNLSNLKGLIQ